MAFWLATLLIGAAPAGAQIVVNANDDVNLKLGVLGQFQADTIDNPGTEPNTNNLFIRRLRLIFGGQVAKNVSFFVETDAPNLGKTLAGGKNIQPSLILQDANRKIQGHRRLHARCGPDVHPVLAQQPAERGHAPANRLRHEHLQPECSDGVDNRPRHRLSGQRLFRGNRLEYRMRAFQGVRDAISTSLPVCRTRPVTTRSTPRAAFLYGNLSREEEDPRRRCRVRRAKGLSRLRRRRILRLSFGPGAVTAQFDYNHFDVATR